MRKGEMKDWGKLRGRGLKKGRGNSLEEGI